MTTENNVIAFKRKPKVESKQTADLLSDNIRDDILVGDLWNIEASVNCIISDCVGETMEELRVRAATLREHLTYILDDSSTHSHIRAATNEVCDNDGEPNVIKSCRLALTMSERVYNISLTYINHTVFIRQFIWAHLDNLHVENGIGTVISDES